MPVRVSRLPYGSSGMKCPVIVMNMVLGTEFVEYPLKAVAYGDWNGFFEPCHVYGPAQTGRKSQRYGRVL